MIGHNEGVVFDFHGTPESQRKTDEEKLRSSSGKSTAARVASSLIGEAMGKLVTLDATKRGLEEFCADRNNLVAILDERIRGALSMNTHGLSVEELPYFVSSGQGKVRSKAATNVPTLNWLLPAITTGEDPLDDPNDPNLRREGARVRMVSLTVPPADRGGIFNRVKGTPEQIAPKSMKLMKLVEATITDNYGVAMPAYLAKLVPKRAELEPVIKKVVEAFVVQVVGANTTGWERRFAEKFGVVLAAAILLARFDVAPWSEDRAHEAIANLYVLSRAASISQSEATDRFLKRIRKLAEDEERFKPLDKGEAVSLAARKKLFGRWTYL
jgi:uncharacterized protein (DUF927 family)